MKTLNSKKKKPEAEAQAGSGNVPMDPPSMDDLEKVPEPAGAEDGGRTGGVAGKQRAAAPAAKKKKLTDADKSRYLGMAATGICVAALACFVAFQMFLPGSGGGRTEPSQDPSAGTSQGGAPARQESPSPGVELQPSGQGNAGAWETPLDRAPWDYRLESEDGSPAAPSEGAGVQDGARYWVRSRSGEKAFQITVPAGYDASDMGDVVEIARGDMGVTGSDPLSFTWQAGAVPRCVLEFGRYDYLEASGATGYSRYDVTAVGYYLFDDAYGQEWPVVTAELVRSGTDPELSMVDDFSEYWIVVGKPVDGQYLVGRIPMDGFSGIATQLCPDVTSLAKALFQPSSMPGMPDAWSAQEQAAGQPEDSGPADAAPAGAQDGTQ